MNTKYVVCLTQEEGAELTALASKGKAGRAHKIKYANVLLKAELLLVTPP